MTCMGEVRRICTGPCTVRGPVPPAMMAAAPRTGTSAAVPGKGVVDVKVTTDQTTSARPTHPRSGRPRILEMTGRAECDEPADRQLPGSGRQREERPGLGGIGQPDGEGARGDGDEAEDGARRGPRGWALVPAERRRQASEANSSTAGQIR